MKMRPGKRLAQRLEIPLDFTKQLHANIEQEFAQAA